MKLEESHTTIITNCNLLTAGKFPPKVCRERMQEKTQERVMSQRFLQVAESSMSLWRMVLKKSLK
jgi:hypothetical protein